MSDILEKKFEDDFCRQLETTKVKDKMLYSQRKNENIDLATLIDSGMLEKFLLTTQKDEVKELQMDFGDNWINAVKNEIWKKLNLNGKALEKKMIFEVIKEDVEVRGKPLRLFFVKPSSTRDQDAEKRYISNVFTYVRQFVFDKEKNRSIDIVLFINGLPFATIELKRLFTNQNVNDAVQQYIERDKTLPIFKIPFAFFAADDIAVKVAAQFTQNLSEDFMPFNKDINNPQVENDYPIEYLYHDVLRPESILDLIENCLFCETAEKSNGEKYKRFMFPRFHQRRAAINLRQDIALNYAKTGRLGSRYIIHHSAGSGKSYTIAVMQKLLRNLHDKSNQNIFDSIIIITDRHNLDKQLSGTVSASETQVEVIKHAKTVKELAKFLNDRTKVIVSTIQKLSHKNLDTLIQSQKGKRICFIIDEAHRSQSGKMRTKIDEVFDLGANPHEKIIDGFAKKDYPNMSFVALTATPSDKTLALFGGKPFDFYGMDQAEQEKYILNVVKNVVEHDTLFKLSEEVKSPKEYPALLIRKKVNTKAFSDDNIIKEKIQMILSIFKEQTENKIGGKAKAMIITNSRLAAVKYKIFMDEALRNARLPHKTLVAFSGSKSYNGKDHTEVSMNKIEQDIEDEFKLSQYRFLIVANKFQYGYDQSYLHTMFLDKAVSGINAVQTISRLNRMMPGKSDTLVVDFTGSYKDIISAFNKFRKEKAFDFSGVNFRELQSLEAKILAVGIFSRQDVSNFMVAENKTSEMMKTKEKIDKMLVEERQDFKSSINKFNEVFDYLNNLFRITDSDTQNFAVYIKLLAKFIEITGKGGIIDLELEKIRIVDHRIIQIKHNTPLQVRETSPRYTSPGKRELQYATVEEIIHAVNANFGLASGATEQGIFREYIEELLSNKELVSSIKANRGADLERLYKHKEPELHSKAIDFFLRRSNDNVADYLVRNVFTFLNRQAFLLASQTES